MTGGTDCTKARALELCTTSYLCITHLNITHSVCLYVEFANNLSLLFFADRNEQNYCCCISVLKVTKSVHCCTIALIG